MSLNIITFWNNSAQRNDINNAGTQYIHSRYDDNQFFNPQHNYIQHEGLHCDTKLNIFYSAVCRYSECHYAECRGASSLKQAGAHQVLLP
jgi:hypothetical protein